MNAVFHPKGPTFLELAKQALSSTEKGYDLLAPKFEYTPFRTPDWLLEPVFRALGGPDSVDRGIDVCCGTGAGMRFLRPMCRVSVTGIDMSAGMLDEAKSQLAGSPGKAALEFVHGDAFAMPFENRFDVAVCFGALGHIVPKDEARFVDAVRKTLKIGGRFAFVTSEIPPVLSMRWIISRGFNAAMHVRNALIDPPFVMFYLTFTLPEIRKKLEACGYSVVEKGGLFPEPFDVYKLVIATREK